MPKDRPESALQEAFVQVEGGTIETLQRAIEAIEKIGGRVRSSYPPRVIIASIPSEKIAGLIGKAGIQSIDTEEIPEERLKGAEDDMALAITAWNRHLQAKRGAAPEGLRGLPWDTPGLLPPDGPPAVQEELRRREREMQRKKKPDLEKTDKNKG